MNIRFKSKKLFNILKLQTISTFKVGSYLYNLNNENSDINYLSIYIEPPKNRNSFLWSHHQL